MELLKKDVSCKYLMTMSFRLGVFSNKGLSTENHHQPKVFGVVSSHINEENILKIGVSINLDWQCGNINLSTVLLFVKVQRIKEVMNIDRGVVGTIVSTYCSHVVIMTT